MRIKAGQLMSGPPCWKLVCLCCVFHLVKSVRVWNHRLVSPYLTKGFLEKAEKARYNKFLINYYYLGLFTNFVCQLVTALLAWVCKRPHKNTRR